MKADKETAHQNADCVTKWKYSSLKSNSMICEWEMSLEQSLFVYFNGILQMKDTFKFCLLETILFKLTMKT